MRGKKAKRLRRAAEGATIGLPSVNYRMVKVSNSKGEKYQDRGMIVLYECTRALYRKMKRLSR